MFSKIIDCASQLILYISKKNIFQDFPGTYNFQRKMFPKEIFYISRRVCGRRSGQLNRILLLRPSFHFSQILFESVVKLLSPLCLISLTTTRNFSNLFVSVLVCSQLSNWNTYISMWFLYWQINYIFLLISALIALLLLPLFCRKFAMCFCKFLHILQNF